MQAYQKEFIELARSNDVLKFGQFTLKSGRVSPYFFNAGAFATGAALAALGRCYAQRIVESGVEFDVLLGPAYKGIPLAAATAIALADEHGRPTPFAYNRKEAKDHGEGGLLVGAPVAGRVPCGTLLVTFLQSDFFPFMTVLISLPIKFLFLSR